MIDLEAGPEDEGGQVASDASPDTTASAPVESSTIDHTAEPGGDPYDFDSPEFEPPKAEAPAETSPGSPGAESAAPVTTAAAAPAAPAVAQAISPEQVQRAVNLGIPAETIGLFGDSVKAELAIAAAERAAIGALRFAAQQQQAPPPQAQQQQQLPPLVEPGPAPAAFDEAAYRNQLQTLGYEQSLQDNLVNQAKGQHQLQVQAHALSVKAYQSDVYNRRAFEYMQKQDQRLAQLQQENQQARVAQQQELIARDYDAFKGSLPEPIQKLVSDPQAQQQIMAMADSMLFGMHQRGQQLPPNSEAFKMAAYAVLGDKMQQRAVEQVRQEVKTHQQRAVSRPSSAGAKTNALPPGPDRAAAFWEAGLAKAGFKVNGSETPEF